ncbi:MAG: MFS transporter, partial [Nocardioides sp.]
GWVFRHRVVVAAMVTSLVVGVLMMGMTSYIPLYGQAVLGHGAAASGLALAAIALGWPLAASNSGRLYLTIGFRRTMLIGGVVAVAGASLLLLLDRDSSILMLAAPCFVLGLGFGLLSSPAIIAAQSAVSWDRRAVATGSTMFARSIGSAVGVAVFGAIVNGIVATRLGRGVPDLEHLTPAVLEPAINAVFAASAIVALALLGVGLLMPSRIPAPDESR